MFNKIKHWFKNKGEGGEVEKQDSSPIPFDFTCPHTLKQFKGELPHDTGIIIPTEQDLIRYSCGIGIYRLYAEHINYFLLVSGMIEKGVDFARPDTSNMMTIVQMFVKEQSEKLLKQIEERNND